MVKRIKTKGQTMTYKTLWTKLSIEQHEPHYKPGLNSGAVEGSAVSAPHVTSMVLLLNDTNIIWYGVFG